MFARLRNGLDPTVLPGLQACKTLRSLTRFKSGSAMQVDKFPYKDLTVTDMKHMSADMEYSTSIPLRSLYAQHRPLMPVPKPGVPSDEASIAEEPVWVNVAAHRGIDQPVFKGGRPVLNPVPESVAHQLGPFLRGQRPMAAKRAPQAFASHSSSNLGFGIANPQEINAALSRLKTMMNQITEENLPGGIGFIHLPLSVDSDGQVPIVEESVESHDVDATSVRRKRKLKMNRHKYRKRLKEQRTLRRRLSK